MHTDRARREDDGTLVTIEGIDGAGKTTVWEALSDARDGTFTREPTDDSWYGEAVRRSLGSEDADPVAELFLYTADHAAHLSRVVRPALSRGELVVADRFNDSRYAYQGASLQGELRRPMEYVRGIHQPFTVVPDLTIYLDVDPHVGADRVGGDADKFERADFLASVRENYEQLIEYRPERYHRIDATRPPEDVIAEAERAVDRVLGD